MVPSLMRIVMVVVVMKRSRKTPLTTVKVATTRSISVMFTKAGTMSFGSLDGGTSLPSGCAWIRGTSNV